MQSFDWKATRTELRVGDQAVDYFSLRLAEQAGCQGISKLPYTLKIVLENQIRQHVKGLTPVEDVLAVSQWLRERRSDREIGLRPARVLMPDSSGIPLLGDMAAMRDAMVRLGGDPRRVNPQVPVDFIVDHSVMVDEHGHPQAFAHNMTLEMERNKERYDFLRWGQQAFGNLRIVPPGSGICHQVNLEYLARVVWTVTEDGVTEAMPDSVIGMDSHTAMINSLGVLGWGVGGLEGGVAALGEPVSMLVPEVVGCRLTGKPAPAVTATDIALTITQLMRANKVVGKFIEFFGPGVDQLGLPDRATISNMTPEYGATMGFFPVDAETLRFLAVTGRPASHIALVEAYCRAQGLWRDEATAVPDYSQLLELDLATVQPSVSGPRRPHQRVALGAAPQAFRAAYPQQSVAPTPTVGKHALRSGDVVIAAITSCTNTSNPAVMIGAGLLARNAVKRGLVAKPWVKTSLSPGSRVVADYLGSTGLIEPLERLGFHVTGFGCMTCMGNSGPLPDAVAQAIEDDDLATVAVLSGNRNFEGRIHPSVQANFLASPPLVVAYALAGSVDHDLEREPLGEDRDGKPVYLRDIWPSREEINALTEQALRPVVFLASYTKTADAAWSGEAHPSPIYRWDPSSTFIRRPPFFDDITIDPPALSDIRGARVLGIFGDMLTTDHISPIGSISSKTPAGKYLASLGIAPKDFVNYGARRLNHDVMIRGTFANVRIRNEMTPGVEGSWTRHEPSKEEMPICDAAARYAEEAVPLVIVAGAEYGAGSSRDWAAKGTRLLGVRAVIAESFERIHRSNLIGLGVLPLQFMNGDTRQSLKLDGSEVMDVTGLTTLHARMDLQCHITRSTGESFSVPLRVRLDTQPEMDYYRNGGIFHAVIRRLTKEGVNK